MSIPTESSLRSARSWTPYSPRVSTLCVVSALSARWWEKTRNSSLVTSEKTVATSPSTLTTKPASPSWRPWMHRTCEPILKDLRRFSLSTSSTSWRSSCSGLILTVPSPSTRSTIPVRFLRSPLMITTWSPVRNTWSAPADLSPSDAARASRFASVMDLPAPPSARSSPAASSPAVYLCSSSSGGSPASLHDAKEMVLMK
mmetsp:Transcript_1208/g.5380  ORF Transcript_1208/g.5380 Transcript_1208/m.5380 type:complete len:200 (+) Transcript_1208:1396-1995(+)